MINTLKNMREEIEREREKVRQRKKEEKKFREVKKDG